MAKDCDVIHRRRRASVPRPMVVLEYHDSAAAPPLPPLAIHRVCVILTHPRPVPSAVYDYEADKS